LIVIVVIAILAAISVVAYGGIQERAHNTKVLHVVAQYQRLIEVYAAQNDGLLPQADWACLGEMSDYPAEDGYQEGWCYKPVTNQNPPAGDDHPVSEILNNRLHDVAARLPSGRTPNTPGVSGRTYRGIFYDSSNLDTNGGAVVLYYLKGSQECANGHQQQYRNSVFTSCLARFTSKQE
jgi:type II secretory pathway pseudopilin PulG